MLADVIIAFGFFLILVAVIWAIVGRKAPPSNDRAGLLIWRSTGLFGHFRMPVATRLLLFPEFANFTDQEYHVLLKRYWEHVSHWNISIEVIGSELSMVAKATGRDARQTMIEFDRFTQSELSRSMVTPA